MWRSSLTRLVAMRGVRRMHSAAFDPCEGLSAEEASREESSETC